MKFAKGQEVIALDIDRKPHRMKVWSVSEKTVFVATSNLFEAIESGKRCIMRDTNNYSEAIQHSTWTRRTFHFPISTHQQGSRIPAPKTESWVKSCGSWENFTRAVHKSIGKDLGSGVVVFYKR